MPTQTQSKACLESSSAESIESINVSEAHLHRYLHEFDFRYNNRVALGIDDATRATRAIQGAAGKRLTYRQPRSQAEEAGAA
jgi:hypothetical protein